jgi:hypothetical protein
MGPKFSGFVGPGTANFKGLWDPALQSSGDAPTYYGGLCRQSLGLSGSGTSRFRGSCEALQEPRKSPKIWRCWIQSLTLGDLASGNRAKAAKALGCQSLKGRPKAFPLCRDQWRALAGHWLQRLSSKAALGPTPRGEEGLFALWRWPQEICRYALRCVAVCHVCRGLEHASAAIFPMSRNSSCSMSR